MYQSIELKQAPEVKRMRLRQRGGFDAFAYGWRGGSEVNMNHRRVAHGHPWNLVVVKDAAIVNIQLRATSSQLAELRVLSAIPGCHVASCVPGSDRKRAEQWSPMSRD